MRDRMLKIGVTMVVTNAVLQIIPDVLGDERAKCPVKVFFLAKDTLHVPIAHGLHILAPAETERQIGAFETLIVFPDVKTMGLLIVDETSFEIAYAKLFSSDESRTFVKRAVVVYYETVLKFCKARRGQNLRGTISTTQYFFPEED